MTYQKFLYFSLAYSLLIIYGSLIPLDYHPKPFEQAWLSFSQIRYLNLGAGSRADWIANIILYIPLTFSLAAFFIGRTKSRFQTIFTSILILSFSITLAVTIEFYQQFFPPRTVSKNDLIAETIGSIIGLSLWFAYGKKLLTLFTQIIQGGKNALFSCAILYILGYLFISFFPYDFIASHSELEYKLSQGNEAFFISNSCGGMVRCTSKLASEIVLAIPLGIFFSVIFNWHPQRLVAVMLVGFVLGAIIESMQLFLISGITQGVSVFARVMGVALGAMLYNRTSQFKQLFNSLNFKKYLIIASLPYLLLLASLNGWSIFNPHISFNITEKFNNINWLPFYYHYYTSEAVALVSLLSIFIMYSPIGIGVWLWNINNIYKKDTSYQLRAGLYAVCLSLVMESGKFFFTVEQHVDPTNLIISFSSAYISYSLAKVMYQWFQHSEINPKSQHKTTLLPIPPDYSNNKQHIANYSSVNRKPQNPLAKIIAFFLFALLSWKTIDYPVSSTGLAAILLLYGVILQKYSSAWLIVLPALLPILDFAPWTGRFFFSEFDYFVLLTLAVTLWNGCYLNPFRYFKIITNLLLCLFIIAYSASLLKGLLPLQPIDNNAFTNYYSHYNSLRVGKGVIWAFLLLPSLGYNYHQSAMTKIFFAYGILLGLTGVVLTSIWERFIFTGLFNYTNDYRITATFSSMHTGGGHIDTYLVTAMPFITVLFFSSKTHFIRSILGISLFLSSLYVLLVTFSRGPYFAFSIQFVILTITLFIARQKQSILSLKKALLIPLFLLIIPLIAIPVLKGSYIQERFSQINRDYDIRVAHWNDAIQMMHSDFFTTLSGMGLGAYPRTYFWSNSENTVPATYSFNKENNTSFLRLFGGDSLYMEQKVNTSPYSKYLLTLDYRSNLSNPALTIPICEKGLLYSFNCRWQTIKMESKKNRWIHAERIIDMKSTGSDMGKFMGKLSRRPIKIGLYNGNNAVIDIKNISLFDSTKTNIIRNGDFSKGIDHWFFSTDNHLPWHSKNIWIQILFDQGWSGVFIFTTLLFYAFIQQFKRLQQKDNFAPILLTSLTGFLIVGAVASPFDAPRITLLFFLILFLTFFDNNRSKLIPSSK